MIEVEVFGGSSAMGALAVTFDGIDGVSRVRVVEATRPGCSVITARVHPADVDAVLDVVRRQGVPDDDISLKRVDAVASLTGGQAESSLMWSDVIGTAWVNARPLARYLVFMIVAGVIGGYGVIDDNVILIVGAMAVAPDLLPITAVAVGLVGRQLRLAARALATVALGLGAACLAAASSTFVQDRLDLVPSGFDLRQTGVLGDLTSVGNETIVVALVAGIAGMLALETRASAGVGVAISVTTIPAGAYIGVAAGLGDLGEAGGTTGVLAVNVTMMVVGAAATLVVQALALHRAPAGWRRGSPR
jgi:uncharacterized hydrophobic protein (TIGR00271 family)